MVKKMKMKIKTTSAPVTEKKIRLFDDATNQPTSPTNQDNNTR